MKDRSPHMLGHKTRLCMLRKHGSQFSGFSARAARDPVTGEFSCSFRWPGGLLLIGFVHTVPGLVRG